MASREPHESVSTPNENIPGLPDFGWRMKLDYECTEKCKPFQTPRLSQLPDLVGLGVRYGLHMMKCRFKGRKPHMDFTRPILHKPMYGCPMGGIGTGTIGRGYRGEFCRFQMVPGMYEYHIVQADAFLVTIRKEGQTVYQKVLTGTRAGKALKTWEWGFPLNQATYQALFPRAWTVYEIPEFNVKLTCAQISPVIPDDYKDTSFPMTAFIWTVENNGADNLDISITFTFKNGQGSKKDREGGVWTEPFSCDSEGRDVSGVMINQVFRDMKCIYALAGAKKEGVDLSYKVSFDPQGTGADLWDDLKEDGKLNSTDGPSPKTLKGKEIGSAVCLQCSLKPAQSETLEFSLAWDMPLIHFRSRELLYARRYTRWFGKNSDAGPRMSSYCLKNYKMWEEKIEAWQNRVLKCSEIPAWYKSALFNELYYLCDGGTVWLDPRDTSEGGKHDTDKMHDHIKEYSKFAYLEGQEYRMYNTYDVHFYASFALIMLWPELQLSLQYDYGEAILGEDTQTIKYCMHGIPGPRKTLNTVPHDVGDPEDEPWKRVNSYNIHPTHDWKDLNLKFVLQVYRDYYATQDLGYLEHMYPIMKALMEFSLQWDTDDDGMIENGGFADQTFDAWIVHGVSAYCGSLWLCALRMFVESAKILGHKEDEEKFTEVLRKAKESFEVKLWNGKYYNYDCSTAGYHDSIMADQLAGNWYLKASGICDTDSPVFPDDHVKSALQCIFDNNVMKFGNGNMGAINGTRPDGKKDISSCQSEEFWVGVTYGLAANMIQEGLKDMAFKTAWGNYNVCWEWLGLMFQSPEAYMTSKHYRSLGYMRPLAIWAMQWALEKYYGHIFTESAKSDSATSDFANSLNKDNSDVSSLEKDNGADKDIKDIGAANSVDKDTADTDNMISSLDNGAANGVDENSAGKEILIKSLEGGAADSLDKDGAGKEKEVSNLDNGTAISCDINDAGKENMVKSLDDGAINSVDQDSADKENMDSSLNNEAASTLEKDSAGKENMNSSNDEAANESSMADRSDVNHLNNKTAANSTEKSSNSLDKDNIPVNNLDNDKTIANNVDKDSGATNNLDSVSKSEAENNS